MAGERVALLRGVNVGSSRRIPMPELRELFTRAGFDDVRTGPGLGVKATARNWTTVTTLLDMAEGG